MSAEPVRYLSADEDSARWSGFAFRDGDIVISTRSKSGTTWVQMICALLIFQTPRLDAPLGWYSPWLDRLLRPTDEIFARLDSQQHRRFIKTHTPLDGIPLDPRVTYLVTGRHPLDMAVSLYHQGDNINRAWQRQVTRQLTGATEAGNEDEDEDGTARKPLREWLVDWIGNDASPRQEMDSIRGVMWHLSDAWSRRSEPNVALIHYNDLCADLDGQMRQLAGRLAIFVPEHAWPELVQAATFASMRASAEQITGSGKILKSSAAFFRRGTPGAGQETLTDDELALYHARAAELASPDLLRWLHGEDPG